MRYIVLLSLLIAFPCFASTPSTSAEVSSSKSTVSTKPIMLAQAKAKKKTRKRRKIRTSRDKTKIDFSKLDIDAGTKSGLELYIDNIKAKRDYDNIQIRTKWTKEMIQSALSLETGRGNR